MSMRRIVILAVICLLSSIVCANKYVDTSEENWTYGNMYQWRTHLAYSVIDEVQVTGNKVFALSNHSLFSIDKISEEIEYHSRLTGLSSAVIDHMYYNHDLDYLLLCYQNGQLDIIDSNEDVYNISDLYLKQANISKQVSDIKMHHNKAFMAMNFGIICLDMKQMEIDDTYYIGEQSTEVDVDFLAIMGDTLYAASQQNLYSANLGDNLMDYAFWHKSTLPLGNILQGMCVHEGKICVIRDNALWVRHDSGWKKYSSTYSLRGFCETGDNVFVLLNEQYGTLQLQPDFSLQMTITYGYNNHLASDGNIYWLATQYNGLVRVDNGNYQEFHPEGPVSNVAYRMRSFGDRLYVLPGGRWAVQNFTYGEIMYYEDGHWTNIANDRLTEMADHALYDCMNVAQDPNDKNHYFVTTYGTGMLEMYDTVLHKLHLPHNSGLESVVPSDPDLYTRTDGAMFDEQGNLWVLNAGRNIDNIRILTPQGEWKSFHITSRGTRIPFHTPGEIVVDRRNTQWKWIPLCRENTGLILLKDNGTPTNGNDDSSLFRNEWFDQNGNQIIPEFIYSLAQDHENTIWVGTSRGLFTIPATVDFFESNSCERLVILRNDGTNLGDYLLEKEQINCIVVDGANRKWIGTAASGAFLIDIVKDEDGGKDVETIAHFTMENSLLPSDNVLSIAIQESTGEVFFGTSEGLVSYMSDAVEPAENFNNLYVYPNPVYPNYKGHVVVKGLVANSQVRILDASGNLVRMIEGEGGEVIWDVTNMNGDRVASGVYTILCNTIDGKAYGHVKVMIMN